MTQDSGTQLPGTLLELFSQALCKKHLHVQRDAFAAGDVKEKYSSREMDLKKNPDSSFTVLKK